MENANLSEVGLWVEMEGTDNLTSEDTKLLEEGEGNAEPLLEQESNAEVLNQPINYSAAATVDAETSDDITITVVYTVETD